MSTKNSKVVAVAGGGGRAVATRGRPLAGRPEQAEQGAALGGGGISVTHTRRALKSYNFTDSDLDTIGLTNVISNVALSVAAAVATFCLNLNVAVMMAGDGAPPASVALQWTINWLGVPIAIIVAGVGIMALVKRGSVISRVKRDSESV